MTLSRIVAAVVLLSTISMAVLPGSLPVHQLGGWGDRGESGGAGFTPSLVPAASSGTTQTSTAQQHVFAVQTFNRTSTESPYGGNATNKLYTFDVSPYSTIYAASMSFVVSVSQGEYARVLVTQGGTTLVNTTGATFSVTPALSTTSVTERILGVSYLNGTTPGTGLYPVYTNETSTIQFALFGAAAWNYSKITYTESLTTWVNTSFGWYLNSTTLSSPFPSGVAVNYATLTVTGNGSAVTYQVSPTALFVLFSNLPPYDWLRVVATFTPAPTASPPNPVIVLPVPIISAGTYSEGVVWSDTGFIAYNGIYTLELSDATPLLVSSVTLRVGTTTFSAVSFAVTGTNITILPGYLTVFEGQALTFTVTFQHSSSGATNIPGNSLVITQGAGYTITLGDVLLIGAGLTVVYIVALVIEVKHPTREDLLSIWYLYALLIGIFAVYVAGI